MSFEKTGRTSKVPGGEQMLLAFKNKKRKIQCHTSQSDNAVGEDS